MDVEEGTASLDGVDWAVFAESIRCNLDPFLVHSDKNCFGVRVSQISTKITEQNCGGGLRQTQLCLAREMLAILRLLVLDEATSSCD